MFDFYKATKNIGGWLTEAEGLYLYSAAKNIESGDVIVEIGSWKGRSTICLGNGSRDGNGAKLFAIDPHTGSSEHQKTFGKVDTFKEFKQNIDNNHLNEFVEAVRDTSKNVVKDFNQRIGFIFIDGAHEYKLVTLDFKLWFPKVKNGGILAFHDSWHFIGPNLSTAIPILISSKIKNPKLTDTITYFEKVERNSLFDRFRNIAFVVYRTFFGIRGLWRLKYQSSKIT